MLKPVLEEALSQEVFLHRNLPVALINLEAFQTQSKQLLQVKVQPPPLVVEQKGLLYHFRSLCHGVAVFMVLAHQ